ncbi:hypothetical protein [Candidatus Enterococcus ikei]|uniref:Uncharacterized protein n=1 Tax=Candidatus Enterococcus ikei TaxID=2815326 RepID=A0ABS3GVZ9_9ENTE|nr:hypothetical protein [Enterococcus sp. DIV0869a]MBO0438995.1 hypothetical protein [Enterococcus sp. DIV0869a]
MNIYDYENRTLNPLFLGGTYEQKIKQNKPKETYVQSINLLLLSINRLKEDYGKAIKSLLPNFQKITENVECDEELGYQKWIKKKLAVKTKFDSEGISIAHKENDLNPLENLLIIFIFQNFPKGPKRYKKQLKKFALSPMESAKELVSGIRTKTKQINSEYTSLVTQYGVNYIYCYMGMQVLFLSAYNEEFYKLMVELFQNNLNERLELYKKQEKLDKCTDEEVLKKFMKDTYTNGSSFYEFEVYKPFIDSIRSTDAKKFTPRNPYFTDETGKAVPETYTVLFNRDTKWWLRDYLIIKEFITDEKISLQSIDQYELFVLLDTIVAEVFFPGMEILSDRYFTEQHEFRQTIYGVNHYLTSGYGRLSLLLTCSDNSKYGEDYWF